jgi:uncharacterized protein DUF4349
MKRTLITIALTTVVVLTLVGLLSSSLGSAFNLSSRTLNYGMGGGGGVTEPYAAEAPAAPAPSVQSFGAATDASKAADALSVVGNAPALQAQQARKVIKNDQLSLLVKDPAKSMKDIIALAEQMGGYVVSSNLYQTTYGPNNIFIPQAQVVVRVPAVKLIDATEQIKKGAVEVQSENLTGQDVTDQYVDLQSRLAADQAAADQLTKIMQDTTKTEDVLNVFQQLRQLQSDIEVLKGQIKYIDQSTDTSEINVTLIAEQSAQPIEVGGWKLQGTAKDAVQDLINFTQNFTRFLIRFVLSTLPELLLLAIPFFLIFLGGRGIYRRVQKSRAQRVQVEEKVETKEENK